MKRDIDISQTFKIVQQLPLEVPFQQVESWVQQHPTNGLKSKSWVSYFLAYWFGA